LQTTVQDLGREGFGAQGISPSGAADPIALRIGNRLVGNAENAAGLEMTLVGGTFRFGEQLFIALTGSDFGAELNGVPLRPWTSFAAQTGQTLSLGATRGGARCYLCVRGGIDVPLFLGSASTHVLSGLGGLEGRPLRRGDVLRVASSSKYTPKIRVIAPQILAKVYPGNRLRVTAGPQSDRYPGSSQRAFYEGSYRVTEESNRMGLRLKGAAVMSHPETKMITEGVSLGAIQIPPSGQPIILFVEQQTTGGYPKIANVISADLHRLGQLRPRDEIRFERIKLGAATALLKAQEQLMDSEEIFQHAID
jgi:antagonist of KipI